MAQGEQGPRLIFDELSPKELAFFEAWQIEERARVVPAILGRQPEFAVWHGGIFSTRGETPVLAVTINSRQVFPNPLLNWIYGVADKRDIDSAASDQLNALLDAARFPADTLRSTLGLLACMAPIEQAVAA